MAATIANVEMAKAWNGAEGDGWARDWEHYDIGVHAYHVRLLEAAAVQPGERVLDIGCGNGQVARDLARQGAVATGIDLSRQMIAKARELADLPGLDYVEGDAQVYAFPAAAFDVVVSRFGAMFFTDRRAAFANLARATRPGGRLALMAWQGLADNEWLTQMRGALDLGRGLPLPPNGTPGPFGLADTEAACADLRAVGYGDATATAVLESYVAGQDVEDAMAFLEGTGAVRGLLEGLPDETADRGRAALRESVIRHDTGSGVVFGSACWLITATRDA